VTLPTCPGAMPRQQAQFESDLRSLLDLHSDSPSEPSSSAELTIHYHTNRRKIINSYAAGQVLDVLYGEGESNGNGGLGGKIHHRLAEAVSRQVPKGGACGYGLHYGVVRRFRMASARET